MPNSSIDAGVVEGVLLMANYLLVHGAWHGAWCWEAVATALEGRGHFVAIPTLPGLDVATQARAGSFGLADHISAVSTAIDHIPGRLILVAHSYAGMTGSPIRIRSS